MARRGYGGRRGGSIAAVADACYDHIQAGGRDLTRLLHLGRLGPALEETAGTRREQARSLREAAEAEESGAIAAGDDLAAAIVYTGADRRLLE